MKFQFFSGRRVPHAASASDSDQVTTPSCPVERECAAFHAAHDAMITLTEGRDDEFDVDGLAELSAQRDKAFQQLRLHPARSYSACRAKLRVLLVMRKWFAVDDPGLSAFAIELAIEATSLLDSAPDQHRAPQLWAEVLRRHPRGPKRRTPVAWPAGPGGNATDTPFAN